jgi:hypothetical protein
MSALAISPAVATVALGANFQFTANGGSGSYTFSVLNVAGATINPSSGLLNAPSSPQVFLVSVQDSNLAMAYATVTATGSVSSAMNLTMGSAASNDVLWSANNAIDQNTTTSYSSQRFATSQNDRGTYLAAWLQTGPQSISTVLLTARQVNGVNVAFPQSYQIYVTAADNSGWDLVGTFSNQPDASGVATIPLGITFSTYGVMIVPITLGADDDGNFYFQLAEIDFRS